MTTPANTSHAISEDALRSALSSSKRPRRPNALSASLTFGWRAMLKIKHVPEQLFDAVGNPIIFTLLFTYLLGVPSVARPVLTFSSSFRASWCRPCFLSPPTPDSISIPTSPKASRIAFGRSRCGVRPS